MADKITVKAEVRNTRGSNDARRLRADGKVPIAIYGGGEESVSAVAELGDLAAILRSETGVNTVFTLDIDGVGSSDVIFHDRQIDSIKGQLMHADLRRIAKGEKLELTVPVNIVGEPQELEEGAVLTQVMREVKVFCSPANIPDYVEVDASDLKVGESLHVSDIKVSEGVEIHEDAETVVASIVIVKEPELEPTPEDEVEEPELVSEEGEGEAEGGAEGETTEE